MSIRSFIYAGLAVIAMGFTACSQNEDMAPPLKGLEINAVFSVGGVQTRVNTLGQGNSWENKDELKVKIFTDYDPGSTTVLTFNEETNEWSRTGSFRWLDESDKHTILAIYPSKYDPFIYELPLNQSSPKELKSADLINGFWYDYPDFGNYIKIPMQHRMSLVTVFYEIGAYDHPNKDISNLQICSPCKGADFSLSNNDWKMDTSNYRESSWVDACKIEDSERKSFSAIIVPGSLDTSTDFLKFTLDGQNYTVKLKQRTDFLEGHRYTYSLRKIGRDKVELDVYNQGVIPGWENEEELK